MILREVCKLFMTAFFIYLFAWAGITALVIFLIIKFIEKTVKKRKSFKI